LWIDRNVGESVVIDGRIRITVEKIKTNQTRDKDGVSLSIDAPRDVSIVREELYYPGRSQQPKKE
jgi:carbon storage regulator CsrA